MAEAYLIRAEARLRKNDFIGARDDLNHTRLRAGLPAISTLDPNALEEALIYERKAEFFTEFGHRWFDLKRWGRAEARLENLKPGWGISSYLLPLPETELQANPNLYHKIRDTSMKYLKALISLMFLLCLDTVAKAQQLKPVQETDYERWYSVKVLKTSADADWYEVFKDYENRQDSLMIRARHSQKTYEIPLSSKREFYKDCYVYVKDQTVNVLHLNTGTTQTYEGSTHFEYSDDLEKLLLKPKDPLKPLTYETLMGGIHKPYLL